MDAPNRELASSRLHEIPRGIWALGLVSLFMDLSSEMIHALLPIYLVTVLGASTLTVGFIEGVAEATAMVTKIFSGALSDRLGKRKLLAAIGYGLAAFTKPIFPLAETVGWVVTARFVDRIGKGIRGAPRDALVADLAPAHLRGASFGLRQSLDTVGAFLGPLAAIGLMVLTADSFRTVFWIAVVPAFLAFGLMVFGVEEPTRHVEREEKPRPRLADAWRLSGRHCHINPVSLGARQGFRAICPRGEGGVRPPRTRPRLGRTGPLARPYPMARAGLAGPRRSRATRECAVDPTDIAGHSRLNWSATTALPGLSRCPALSRNHPPTSIAAPHTRKPMSQ